MTVSILWFALLSATALSATAPATLFPTWQGAEYISGPTLPSQYQYGTGGIFRVNFDTPTNAAAATVYVAVNGIGEVFLDGRRLGGSGSGRRVLEPTLTQYEKRMHFVAYNVTLNSTTTTSTHTLGLVLGRGHWSHYQYGKVAAMVQLVVDEQSIVVSSTSNQGEPWYFHPGPILDDDLFNGEYFDGNVAASLHWTATFAGWATAAASTTGWTPVKAHSTPGYRPPVLTNQDFAILPTVTSTPMLLHHIQWLSKDTCVLDFGENGAGWTRLTIQNKRPAASSSSLSTTVHLAHAEMITAAGDIFSQYPCPVPSRVCVNQTDHYTRHGKTDTEVYEPRFTWHGFRYVKVTGCLSIVTPNGSLSTFTNTPPSTNTTTTATCELMAIRVGTNFSATTAPTAPTPPTTLHPLIFPSSPILTSIANMIMRTMKANQIGYQTR